MLTPSNEPKIVCPNDPSYELPIVVVDPRGITEQQMELIQAMATYAPRTRYKAGDLVMMTDVPLHLKRRYPTLPRIWKVRFVVTAWAFEIMAEAIAHGGSIGMDYAIAKLESQKGFHPHQYRQPVIYAHGYPHGTNPNSAAWLPERVLRKLMFRENNQPWENILAEADAPFYGYDPDKLQAPFSFSLAPDDYSSGTNIGRPFSSEEDTTHALCLAGLEEHLFVPYSTTGQKSRVRELDPDHDVFG